MWARGVVLVLLAGGCDLVFGLKHEDVPVDAGPLPPTRWSAVAAGQFHTCGIRLDQTLWCWGRNDFGQLGIGSAVTEVDTPIQVGTDQWSEVSAAALHTCGVTMKGVLSCWGENFLGQLGNGLQSDAPTPTPTPITTATPTTWLTVSTGPSHTCGIDTGGNMSCWGFDNLDQLGDGMPMQINPLPTPVPATTTWTAVVTGDSYTCAIAADQTRWCWGANVNGEIGDGMSETQLPPTQIGTDLWTSLSAREVTTCGIRTDGALRCWGYNDHGQLGNDAVDTENVPTALANDSGTWSAVAAGLAHSCGIASSGTLSCWGNNDHGQLAVATTDPFRTTPTVVTGGPWLALALGSQHTCAIDTEHRLWCAGQDGGELGAAGGGSRVVPVDVGPARMVAVGGQSGCLVDPQGVLRCWGGNAVGAVGDGTRYDRESPVQTLVPTGAITSLAVGDHACAIDTSSAGHLSCWGQNNASQVIDNSNGVLAQLTPIEITPPDPNAPSWIAIAASSHSCGIDSNGHLSCWGLNGNDQADFDFMAMPTVPIPMIAGGTTFSALATGGFHTCGISADSVLCWGDAAFGQLGDNGTVGLRVVGPPAMLPTGTPTSITGGGLHSCAVVGTDGYCWGANANGQIGDQTTDGRGLPTLLDDHWVQLSAGLAFTCGIRADHSLACWGSNAFGELGDGTRLEHHEPVTVGTDSDWTFVATADSHACALKQNGHLFCWGRNLEGEVGDGAAWRTALLEVP